MRHSVLFATAFATLISTQILLPTCRAKALQLIQFKAPSRRNLPDAAGQSCAGEIRLYRNKPSEVDYNVGYTSLASGDEPSPP